MGAMKNIRHLEELLSSNLGNNEKIVDSELSILTAPGENFGSIVLRILIKIENTHTGKYRTIDAVGKILPESKRVQELFNIQMTFTNEFQFYSSIVPLLDKFAKRKGILTGVDFTAPFLGGRINLNDTKTVDTDAIILMQNLKSIGYTTGKKTYGLDFQTSKIVIDSLAKFHAVGLAFKIQEPKSFEEKLRPYFSDYVSEADFLNMVKVNVLFTLQNYDFTEKEIARASAAIDSDAHKKGISEVWGTMIHYDTWTNNMMILRKEDVPVHSMIVDFQDFGYGTPLNDLMFFLFTSVQAHIIEERLNDLLHYYYKTFVGNLKVLGVDTTQYSRESFYNEVKLAVKKFEYCHSIWMLVPIMQEHLTSMDELDKEEANTILNWDDKHVQKIVRITRICLQRDWI